MKRTGFTLALFLFTFVLTGQTNKSPVFYNRTIEDGLYHSYVTSLTQDKFGFMWIGTSEGLQRFDGKHFSFYGKSNVSNDFSNNSIKTLFIPSSQDKLFIGRNNGDLSIYEFQSSSFRNLKIDSLQSGKLLTITSFLELSDSLFILGTRQPGELFLFNAISGKSIKIAFTFPEWDKNPLFEINDLYLDQYGHLWMLNDLGLFKTERIPDFKNTNIEFVQLGKVKNCLSMKQIDGNTHFLLASHGLYELDVKTETIKEIIPAELKNVKFTSFEVQSNSSVWIGTDDSGLINFNLKNGELHYHLNTPFQKKSLLDNSIQRLFYSQKDSTLWIATSKGLSYLNTSSASFRHISLLTKEKKEIDQNFGHLEASNGNIWLIGLREMYYSAKNYDQFEVIHKNHRFSFLYNTTTTKIIEDNQQRVWFGTHNGLYCYNIKEDKIISYPIDKNIPNSAQLNKISNLKSEGDSIWLTTYGGIALFRKSSNSYSFFPKPENHKNTTNHSIDIVHDPKGYLWYSVNLEGIYRYNLKTKEHQHFTNNPEDSGSLSANDVISIFLDADGELWACTYTGGVNRFDSKNKSFIRYTIDNGMPSNCVYLIQQDEKHNLWMSTNRGIVNLNKKTNNLKVFSYLDGLYINEYNMGAGFKSSDGEMYFGGIGGLVSFYPKEVLKEIQAPDIYLTDLYLQGNKIDANSKILNGKGLMFRDSIEIPYNKMTLSFSVSLIEYLFPLRTRFAWKLENYESEWNYSLDEQSVINYTNLPPGQYQLLIKSTSNREIWTKNPYKLHVKIIPPWWKTIWFKLGLIALSLSAIVAFFNIRIRVLKHQKLRLNQLVAEKTEELQTLNENLEESNAEINAQNEELERHRNYLEDIVSERTKQLSIALQKAEESDKLKTSILKNMSHEVRTPLNAIIGFTEIITTMHLNEKDKKEYIKTIQSNGIQLLDLIDKIIEISMIETKSLRLHFESINVHSFISDCINEHRKKLPENLSIRYSENHSSDKKIVTDRFKLSSILNHVLNNAIKYTEKGSIQVMWQIINPKETKTLKTKKTEQSLLIEITDTGIGMKEEHRIEAFGLFWKAENNDEKLYGGLGLGLSIAKKLTEHLGGTIWIESKLNSGSSVKINLPIEPPKEH